MRAIDIDWKAYCANFGFASSALKAKFASHFDIGKFDEFIKRQSGKISLNLDNKFPATFDPQLVPG